MKLLTLAVPTYNRKKSCLRTIKNFIKQIIDNHLENKVCILISDNCSTDGTSDELQKLSEEYSSFVTLIVQKENIGMGNNFIYLVKNCKTKYIQVCGDDDIYYNGSIQDTINIIEKNSPSYIFLNCYWPDLKRNSLNLKEDFCGTLYDALIKLTDCATHISPTVIEVDKIKNTHVAHANWGIFEMILSFNKDAKAYISKKPHIEYSYSDVESNWLFNPDKKVLYYTELLHLSILNKDNELFAGVRNEFIKVCVSAIKGYNKFYNHKKEKFTKKICRIFYQYLLKGKLWKKN